ncbi:CaiB/BaiF CoA transferase family protein [Orrella daihaiensis]|uniref:CoA transferase n=1 Tax=Orrella daihaiensis TaxID=2782176 RepID=A0ABY4AIJ4_9BURK|nr:CoA transferase [Orrella daihaiensis]UOD50106.1 CoA transferase [Orrella daihaiensis]
MNHSITASQSDTNSPSPKGPLSGVRVLDMTAVVMGPLCTQALGDYGANVIKIESTAGDVFRHAPPTPTPAMGSPFIQLNRNKRSLVLNLKETADLQVLLDLAKQADVLVFNIRPQSMRKLGLGYNELAKLNPRLIYCGVYGYSEQGPYAGEPAYDDIIQAVGGLASLQSKDGVPSYVSSVIADKIAGLTATHAILAALYEREKSGLGQAIEVPMFETLAAFNMLEHMGEATFAKPEPQMGYSRAVSPHRRPYQTKDGYIGLLPYTTEQWQRFFQLVDQPDLIKDERFSRPEARARHVNELYTMLSEFVKTKTTEEWLALLKQADIPSGRINSLNDLLGNEHLTATGFFKRYEDPTLGTVIMPKSPVNLSRTPTGVQRLAPKLGADTEDIKQNGW